MRPSTFDVAKSIVWACWRASLVTIEVGSVDAKAAIVSRLAFFDPPTAAWLASWIARNRSPIEMSPVGTSMRTSENAFDPESSVRVLIAIDARSDSTGSPSSAW